MDYLYDTQRAVSLLITPKIIFCLTKEAAKAADPSSLERCKCNSCQRVFFFFFFYLSERQKTAAKGSINGTQAKGLKYCIDSRVNHFHLTLSAVCPAINRHTGPQVSGLVRRPNLTSITLFFLSLSALDVFNKSVCFLKKWLFLSMLEAFIYHRVGLSVFPTSGRREWNTVIIFLSFFFLLLLLPRLTLNMEILWN